MTKTALQFILLAIVLILAQAIVFNHICLFNVAIPFVFVYLIIRLPVTLSQNWSLTIGFFLGLIIDIFSDTQGMNALACTVLAGMRKNLLRLYFPREEDLTDPSPSMRSLGFGIFFKYAVTMSFVYCTLIFIIQAFSFFNILLLCLRIVFSTILTTLIILGIDSLTIRKREKRL